jgi:hypothetical protein
MAGMRLVKNWIKATKTYSSGYTASKIHCCLTFDPERKFIAARGKIIKTYLVEPARRSPTSYTPSPSSERNCCPNVNVLDAQCYERSDVERGEWGGGSERLVTTATDLFLT